MNTTDYLNYLIEILEFEKEIVEFRCIYEQIVIQLQLQIDSSNVAKINKNKNSQTTKKTKKTSDADYIEITSKLFEQVECYRVIDMCKKNKLKRADGECIYMQFKEYFTGGKLDKSIITEDDCCSLQGTGVSKKQNTSNVSNTSNSNSKYTLNKNIDTTDTGYVATLKITTDKLVNRFGKYYTTGTDNTKHRYEYKFCKSDDSSVVFSIYDWGQCKQKEHEESKSCNNTNTKWYLASSTDDEDIVRDFIEWIKDNMENTID